MEGLRWGTAHATAKAPIRVIRVIRGRIDSHPPRRTPYNIRVYSWLKNSLQKQIHAIQVDDGMAEVERVHAEYAGNFAVALLQRELRQRSYAKLFRRRFERADVEVVDFCRTNRFRRAAAKLRRNPRRFRRQSERFDERFVQGGNERAGIDKQTRRLAVDPARHRERATFLLSDRHACELLRCSNRAEIRLVCLIYPKKDQPGSGIYHRLVP